ILDEALVDLRGEASTVAIRYGTGIYPGLQVERLFSPSYVPVCSPALLAGKLPLRAPADLAGHVLIHDETIDDGDQSIWAEWLQAAGADDIDAERGPRFSNAALAIEAALEGQGVALAVKPLVEDDIAAGRLAIPFAVALPSPYAYFLVTAEAVARRPPVAAFRQWLLAEAAAA
ncbi:MAG TPA: LysR substrate-binding domain-containing protein, partial [Rhodocyclaceae bacterium]|nr:LysR substrate-binding domain-containing protein [Rhodocyclaceae bacterium]